MPSFPKMRERCPSTVRSEKERGRDLAVRLALRHERGDAFLGRCQRARRRGSPADPAQLAACSLGPERSADAHEHVERLVEGLSRLTAPLHPALCRTQSQQRAGALEGRVAGRVQRNGTVERSYRSLEVAARRREETLHAMCGGDTPATREELGSCAVLTQQLLGFVQATRLDEGLCCVGQEGQGARLADRFPPVVLDECTHRFVCARGIALGKGQMAERPRREDPGGHAARLPREVKSARGGGGRLVGLAEKRLRERPNGERVADKRPLSGLFRDGVSLFGHVKRVLEPSQGAVDLPEHHVDVGQ